jgi:LruC domain-containing protein
MDQKTLDDLIIPQGFTFETSTEVTIQFQDKLKSGGSARYDVFLHSGQVFNDTITYIDDSGEEITDIILKYDKANSLIASKITDNGSFNLTISVPNYITELFVIKNELGVFTSEYIQVNGKSASFNPNYKNANNDPVDILYGVNGDKDLFTINPVTGESTIIDQLVMGSWTCAVDYVNNKLYTIGRSNPYPLYEYDIETKVFTVVKNLGMGGPRLEYNHADGLLYFSRNAVFYSIDPHTGNVITQKNIEDLDNTQGGDIKVDEDGKWYIATFGGLYWLEFKDDRIIAHKISADNLPFTPTSMTIDSNGELWLADNSSQAQLIVMDKVTGGWEYRFSKFDHRINDLSTFPLDVNTIPQVDSDTDGIIDYYDEYPNDSEKAYNTYTPSLYGVGSLIFEDKWPLKGDYDFNDLVIYYNFIAVMNSQDKVVELRGDFKVEHVGASFSNGFGLELPFHPGLISSVSGYNISAGLVNINQKGLEEGHASDKAVIILFDEADVNKYQTLNLVIKLSEPLEASLVGVAPFNPFIFADSDRGREIHLINLPPTDLVDDMYFQTEDDASTTEQGKYYRTVTGLPWAINMMHGFVIPIEGKSVNKGYNRFNEWAESGGTIYSDWYKNNPGYRNPAYLKGY